MFLAPGNRRDIDVRAQRAVLLREHDPLAVRRNRHGPNPAHVARRDDGGLAVRNAVAVQLPVRCGVEERLRVGCPHECPLLVVEIRDLLRRAPLRIADPHLVAAGSIGHERDGLAVGRPLRLIGARGHPVGRDARDVAAIGRDREQLPARGDDGPASRRRDVERVHVIGDRLVLDLVLLFVGHDVERDLARAPGCHVELPDAEVVLVDDHLAVARHRRPEQAAVGVSGDLNRLACASRRDLVDVVDAPADLGAARLHALVVGQRVGDEVDRPVGPPHRPVAVVALVGEQLRVAVAGEVGDPQVGRVAAAVVLPRPDGRMPVEDERLAVGRVAAPVAPVERQRLFLSARGGNLVEDRHRGERAVAAGRAEGDGLGVTRPADDLVVAGVIRQAPGRAAGGGHDKHIVVAITVGREGNPAAVGREARIHVARRVIGDPLHVRAVLVGGPDVSEIAEGDLAGMVVGVPRELDRRGAGGRGPQQGGGKEPAERFLHGCTLPGHRRIVA